MLSPNIMSVHGSGSLDNHAAHKAVLRKVDWHLLPALCWLTFVTSLTTTNIGLARIEGMERDLDLHNSRFSIAVFVHFIPLVLLDVPANIAFRACRPSRFLFCAVFILGKLHFSSKHLRR